jgi:hypothetical protein
MNPDYSPEVVQMALGFTNLYFPIEQGNSQISTISGLISSYDFSRALQHWTGGG